VKPVGIRDGFFDLGGKSLQAARLFTKMISAFHKELPLTTLIQSPTVELLPNEIRPASRDTNYSTLVPMRKERRNSCAFLLHPQRRRQHAISSRLGREDGCRSTVLWD